MQRDSLRALADRIESAGDIDRTLTEGVVRGIREAFPDQTRLLRPDSAILTSTDAALHLVDAVIPAWDIALKGVALEPDGHWTCTLRKSSTMDDDEMIGFGKAPSLPRALIAAVLRIAAATRHP